MSVAPRSVAFLTTPAQKIEAWRRIAHDPSSVARDPVTIEGTRFIGDDKTIRILITREHANEFFATELFAGQDVLIMSASCWELKTGRRLIPAHPAMMAYIDRLLSRDHALTSFEYPELSSMATTIYRLLLLDSSQQPVAPSPLQSANLRVRITG